MFTRKLCDENKNFFNLKFIYQPHFSLQSSGSSISISAHDSMKVNDCNNINLPERMSSISTER